MTKKSGRAKVSSALGGRGVLIRLELVEPGVVRVRLDDCGMGKAFRRETWPFTHFDVSEERLRSFNLPKQRLYEIGLAVLARLIAFEDLGPDE